MGRGDQSGGGPELGLGAPPVLDWQGGAPRARRFDDPYFSLEGGLAETAHVFHAGNDLPRRLRPGFEIAELGFGTGLNALATALLWQKAGVEGPGHFTSFEAYPMTAADIARALAPFPELAPLLADFLPAWAGGARVIPLGPLVLTVEIGDARALLPRWAGRAEAWFLDGFSPAKNPELWGADLLAEVAAHTAPGGTFATYSAAGHVRAALQAAGFTVERRPGFGRKKHMSCGWLAPEGAAP